MHMYHTLNIDRINCFPLLPIEPNVEPNIEPNVDLDIEPNN